MVQYYSFYTNMAEQNTFQNISSSSQTATRSATGYSYMSSSWQKLYNTATLNPLGKNYINYY